MRFFAIPVNGITFLRHFSWEAASAGSGRPNARWSKRFWRLRRSGVRFRAALSLLDLGSAGLENVLHISPTRSLLHVLVGGAGQVIRRVWTLTCDRETRRPRPRRDGAKLTGAWAPRR